MLSFRKSHFFFLPMTIASVMEMFAGTPRFGWSHNWALIALAGIGAVGILLGIKRAKRPLPVEKAAQHDMFQKPVCPECKSEEFYSGPSGGMSRDILCCKCGFEYCYSPFGLQPLGRREDRAAIYGLKKLPSEKE